jgi:DNA polymerase-3 subunit epsilon
MALRPIFYDTETTGTKPDRDKIIELAAFDPFQNKTFCKLINPGCPIPEEAQRIHNISDEMVKDAPPFGEVAREFVDFCEGEAVLIAHNNEAFDKLFIEAEFKNAALAVPTWPYIDSLKWARKYRSDLPRHSLQFLREVYGIEANQAHRALDDVFTLHKVFQYMVGDLSYETVLTLCHGPTTVHHMPFGKYQGQELKNVPRDYLEWLLKSGALDKKENAPLRNGLEKLGLVTK